MTTNRAREKEFKTRNGKSLLKQNASEILHFCEPLAGEIKRLTAYNEFGHRHFVLKNGEHVSMIGRPLEDGTRGYLVECDKGPYPLEEGLAVMFQLNEASKQEIRHICSYDLPESIRMIYDIQHRNGQKIISVCSKIDNKMYTIDPRGTVTPVRDVQEKSRQENGRSAPVTCSAQSWKTMRSL